MKKFFRPLLILALVGIIFNACKKDDPASNTDNLCQKDWQLTAETINPGVDDGTGTIITDLYHDWLDQCETDNYINFSSDGKYVDYEGATKCDVADPDTVGGNWSWNSNETILILADYGSTPDSITITKNDGTTLSGTSTYVNGGITYTITSTYKKK